MSTIFRYILPLLFFTVSLSSVAKDNATYPSKSQKSKAEYIFMEAQRKKALGEYDAHHELLRYAYSLDTTNTVIAYNLGYSMLLMSNNSKENVASGLSLMKKHIDAKPDDYFENILYANISGKVGNTAEALNVWKSITKIYPQKLEIKYQLADAYANNRDFNSAIALYDSIEINEGMTIPITLRKVNFHLATNDTIGAIKEARRLVDSVPTNVDFNLLLGNLYLQFAKNDSAITYFDKALELDPNNGYSYLYKADYYKLLGDSANYDKQIYNALINKNILVEQKINVLTDYIRQELRDTIQSNERIDNLFNVLIEQHPHEPTIHDLYSQYLVTIKDYTGAAEQLCYVLDLEPANASNWRRLMFVYLMDEEYESALKAADKAQEYDEDNNLYQYIAPAYSQIKQYDKAISTYELALSKTDSTDYELQSALVTGIGDVYFIQGDTLKAFKQYEKAIDLNPGNIMAMNNYAYFLAESGIDLDKAESLSAKTVKYEPENPTYLDTYAWIFFKKGEYSLALTYIKAAIDNSNGEESHELLEHYGDILFMNGKHDEAVPYWEKAYKLNPDSEILQRKVKHKTYFHK